MNRSQSSGGRAVSFVFGLLIALLPFCSAAQISDILSPHGDWDSALVCADCHSSDAWSPMRNDAPFDHDTDTEFALIAAHTEVVCADCHLDLVFVDLVKSVPTCVSCHTDVHDGKLAASCESCHNQQSFREVDGWLVHQDTDFPLLGAHEVTACESCHNDNHGGLFFGDDTSCASCHEADYQQTTVLPHAESGFSLECESCHTQFIWEDAIFPDHALLANGFDLIGAHQYAGCESCHFQPSFELVFNAADELDCYACHQSDYQKEHGGSGYPITCLECHNQNSWDGTRRLSHDGFPIFSGTHKGEWDGCADCHQAAPVMTTFTCVSCHEHRQDRMDSEHREVRNYVFDSLACLSCHPDGREHDD